MEVKVKTEQPPAINPNPVLSVAKDGTVIYSNEAGEPLLNEWGIDAGEKLPSSIVDIVQGVISRNNPEKMEVKVGKRIHLVSFHPSPEEERVNIYGFDISDQKELEEKLCTKEKQNNILHQIGKIALEYKSIQTFMDESVKLIASILDLEFCKIMELLPDGKFLMRAGTGWKSEFVGKQVVEGDKGSQAGYTLLSRAPVIVEDFEVENRFNKPEILKIHGVASGASVIIGSKENTFGVLIVNSMKKRKFTSDDTYFLNSVAYLIAQTVERKNAEESLRRSEDRFRSVLENSLDAAYRRDLQTDSYDHMSPAIEQITGFSSVEMSAMSTNEALNHVHPDDRSLVTAELTRALGAGIGTFDYRFKCKDGKYRWLADYFKVIKDQNGRPLYISGVVRDITERKRAEDILAFERSQLLSIFDGMDDMVYVADPFTYEVLYVNKAMKEKFGGEYVGETCYRKFQRRDSPCDFCTNRIILKERDKPYRWEYYNPTVDRYLMIVDRIIKWPDGRDVRLEIAKDITEHKEAEKALRENEMFMCQLYESGMIGVLNSTVYGQITDANDKFLGMVGYTREDLKAGKINWEQMTPPEYYSLDEHAKAELKATGLSRPFEKEYIRKDGSRIPIIIGVAAIDEECQKAIAFVLDNTERKKAEAKLKETLSNLDKLIKVRTAELEKAYISLKESEERLTDAQKIAHIGSYDWNIATNEEYWSDELYRIFGLDPQLELNHNTFLNRIHPEDLEYVSHAINEALSGKPYNIDYRIVLPDGAERVIYSHGGVIFDEKNTPIRMRGIVQDITERKKAEDALAKIEIARKQEIHHRIKNNLQVISSLLDLQAEQFRNKERIKDSEVLEAFRESQDRVISMALIHEELHKGGEFETLNFAPYIEELAENLLQTYTVGNKNIRLNMDLEENAFFDMDVAVPLGMIVSELVSNSLKYAFPDRNEGEVRIKLHRDENLEYESEECACTRFTLTISDNGVGIPEDLYIENLDSLGLQLVTTLVDQLDGELELKRDNGTVFTIRFIVTEKNNQASAPATKQLID